MQPPAYFAEIRSRAQSRWDQLEDDHELAAPWHQLFKQVQSPRHVISELLQNADDARATRASVSINVREFRFSHNGDDFEAQHFASLCRFGYSNKRALHTIGFRGIGFKSTFSLGDEVTLATPTLSVAFHCGRFTQPIWIESQCSPSKETSVSVAFKDELRRAEITKNLSTWLASPASLLFFRSLRHLNLGTGEVRWTSHGQGPTDNSEWVSLAGADAPRVLLVRSDLEEFPEDCVAEIRQERMLSDHDEALFPPCKVEIVLGLEGRLFVVLPTGVETELPFACNAPFIQDPARVKIKDPETSPTNRWLLQRAGTLAARTMLHWLAKTDLTIAERSQAYRLLPRLSSKDDSIEDTCSQIVSDAFFEAIQHENVLLTSSGDLVCKNGCVAMPTWLTDVWDPDLVSAFFDSAQRPLFSTDAESTHREMLIAHGYLTEIINRSVMTVLRSTPLPRPKTLKQLLILWAEVAPFAKPANRFSSISRDFVSRDLRIVPVQARDNLYSAQEVVRLGEKKMQRSEGDWEFLSGFLLVMNPDWPRYIAEQRRSAEANEDERLSQQVEGAERMLQSLGMSESSDAAKVIDQVAVAFFQQNEVKMTDCIRLTQIAAALSVPVSPSFEFFTISGTRRSPTEGSPLIADSRFDLDTFASEEWCSEHLLHENYWKQFSSCTAEEWQEWLESGSGLQGFIPLEKQQTEIHSRPELVRLLKQRGYGAPPVYPHATSDFVFEDWDFPEEHWRHWEGLAQTDKRFWSKLLRRILEQPSAFWSEALESTVLQFANLRSRGVLRSSQRGAPMELDVLPAWLVKLRQKDCLVDTWGMTRQPAELLCRVPETESLLDVEPFVAAELDTVVARPLLSRLGVRDKPSGPDRLLERLKALSTVTNPPVFEVQKWCHRIDQMLPKCSTEEFQEIQSNFKSECLILATDGTWARTDEIFLSSDDHNLPGVSIVHEAIRPLTIWRKIGVEPKPTLDRIIAWLQTLPRNERLTPDLLRRVKEWLPRHAHRIWFDCGCWLNLEGEWVATESLRYSLAMHSLSAWGHLFPAVKKQVADFQRLTSEVVHSDPFAAIPSLSSALFERVQTNSFAAQTSVARPWLKAIGSVLSRIITDSDERTKKIREIARRLSATCWQSTVALETVPYLDGTPAGTATSKEVLWDYTTLYVVDRPITRLIRQISRELARPFDDAEIEDAIKFCIDRTPEHVTAYLEQNFKIAELERGANTISGIERTAVALANDASETVTGASHSAEHQQGDKPFSVDNKSGESNYQPAYESAGGIEDTGDPTVQNRRLQGRHTSQRPRLQSIMDHFFRQTGFSRQRNDERYSHPDGRWIQKRAGMPFPWEMYTGQGNILKRLLFFETCLRRDPLEIPSEIWDACRRAPERHSLIVATVDDKPQELTGTTLVRMVEEGKLVLYPAAYRLSCLAEADEDNS
jgi:hypothetical protein